MEEAKPFKLAEIISKSKPYQSENTTTNHLLLRLVDDQGFSSDECQQL
jgi:hypothetical protein